MRAALYQAAGDVIVADVADPAIVEPTDVIVQVLRSCVCGSDLWAYRATFERTPGSRLGHEFIGIVSEVGADVRTLRVGELVIAPFSIGDGSCPACQAGLYTSCPQSGTWGAPGYDGGQGEALRVPFADANLVVVPEGNAELGDAELLSLLALTDVLATGLHGAEMAGVSEGSTVAVVGDGAVGLCAVLAASSILRAERIILLSRHADRQQLGRRFGATDIVESRGDEAVAAVRELTAGLGPAHVVEAVGTPQAWETAIGAVRDGGQIGAVGVPHTTPSVALIPLLARNLGVRLGVAPVRRYLPDLLGRTLRGEIDAAPVFDVTMPLADTANAYAAMDSRQAIKVALVP
jgi:threonine dehydrogenase-like Zn-dependent dehydrogenase